MNDGYRQTAIDDFQGVDINTPPELLHPARFQADVNGDRRRESCWRNRRGFSRLLDATGAGIDLSPSFTRELRTALQFERDDNVLFLVGTLGPAPSHPGELHTVHAIEPGEPE